MEAKPKNLKSLQTFYKILSFTMALFFLSAMLMVNARVYSYGANSFNSGLLLADIILSIFSAGFSYLLFSRKLREARGQKEMAVRFELYRIASILQMALCTGPILFSIILFIISGHLLFLLIIGALVLNFLNIYPSKKRLVKQLELNGKESFFLKS